MILNQIFNRLVGMALLLIATLHEIQAFVVVTPSISGNEPGVLTGDSCTKRFNVAGFQRSSNFVRSSSNGLSEWSIPEFSHLSFGTESTASIGTSSTTLSAVPTLDPTTLLSDIFGNILGTPLILAIPVVAALLVATVIAYGIVSYASPAEDEE